MSATTLGVCSLLAGSAWPRVAMLLTYMLDCTTACKAFPTLVLTGGDRVCTGGPRDPLQGRERGLPAGAVGDTGGVPAAGLTLTNVAGGFTVVMATVQRLVTCCQTRIAAFGASGRNFLVTLHFSACSSTITFLKNGFFTRATLVSVTDLLTGMSSAVQQFPTLLLTSNLILGTTPHCLLALTTIAGFLYIGRTRWAWTGVT